MDTYYLLMFEYGWGLVVEKVCDTLGDQTRVLVIL